MCNEIAKYDACVDAVYYCPHHPDDNCDCRKPKPALILRAIEEFEIIPNESFFIGDQLKDVETGHLAGCKTILISPAETSGISPNSVKPNLIIESFLGAVYWIVHQ